MSAAPSWPPSLRAALKQQLCLRARRNQAGGGNWTHAISKDMVHWYHIADALGRGPASSTWDNQGACDGTVSFRASSNAAR